jgi:hypothetical protein
VLLNRYRYIMLAFMFLRERILMDNNLDSFEEVPDYGHDLDQYYYQQSMANEQAINQLKVSHPAIASNIMDYYKMQDSGELCTAVIGMSASKDSNSLKIIPIDTTISLEDRRMYQDLINTITRACKAAYNGDMKIIVALYQNDVDLSEGD